jgi:hypothetical protein
VSEPARPFTGEVPGATEEEVPLVSDGYIQHPLFSRGEPRCEFERTLKGEYCGENSEVRLDGLRLCERHTTQLRLQERLAYWWAMVAHIELWSGEAHRRGRKDVVGLLEVEWERASGALEIAYDALQSNRDGRSPEGEDGKISRDGKVSRDGEDGEGGSGDGRAPPPWWPPLLLLLLLSLCVTG